MSTALPPSLADFRGVLSETKRIINAHTRHFLALSVLFLLPPAFSISVFPILLRCFSFSGDKNSPAHTLVRLSSSSSPLHHHFHHFFHLGIPLKTLGFVLVFSVSVLPFLLSAAGSLTYSSFHGFYGRPVKLAAALSSLFSNFLPILATAAAGLLYICGAFAAFDLCEFLAWKGISLIAGAASQSPNNSPYFLVIFYVGALILGSVLANFAVNWILVSAVVVIENRWGFDALARSRDLVSSMRRTGMSLMFSCGIQVACQIWIISIVNGLRNWTLAVLIVLTSAMLIWILLHGMSAATVFYIYCKAVRGELEDEIASEYLNLPHDGDDKAPRLISVVHD